MRHGGASGRNEGLPPGAGDEAGDEQEPKCMREWAQILLMEMDGCSSENAEGKHARREARLSGGRWAYRLD